MLPHSSTLNVLKRPAPFSRISRGEAPGLKSKIGLLTSAVVATPLNHGVTVMSLARSQAEECFTNEIGSSKHRRMRRHGALSEPPRLLGLSLLSGDTCSLSMRRPSACVAVCMFIEPSNECRSRCCSAIAGIPSCPRFRSGIGLGAAATPVNTRRAGSS